MVTASKTSSAVPILIAYTHAPTIKEAPTKSLGPNVSPMSTADTAVAKRGSVVSMVLASVADLVSSSIGRGD